MPVEVGPDQDLAMIRHSRMVAFNQMLTPMIGLGLVVCVLALVLFTGLGMLGGQLDSSSFTVIAAYLFGVLSGVLGLSNSARAPQRVGDPTVSAPPQTVTATGGESPSVKVTSP